MNYSYGLTFDRKRRYLSAKIRIEPFKSPELPHARYIRDNRIYVTCQTDDALPYSGEDNIVIGSDYGHADTSAEIEALRKFKGMGEVEPRVIDKILYDNAKALYGL
jgi:Amidohydrolase